MIRALQQDAKKVAKVRKHLASEGESRAKKRAKGKWGDVVWSYLSCASEAAAAGLGQESVATVDQLIAECRGSPGAKFEGMLTLFKKFGSMGGLLTEADRLRRFYAGYFQFVERNLGAPDLRYAEDVFLMPVVDPNAGVKRGTNMLLVQSVVTSQAFVLGGTLAIRRSAAELFAYQHPVVCEDQGGGRPKYLKFGDAEIEPMVLRWTPGEVTMPGWFPSRLPDIPVVRIGTPDSLFDILAVEKEEATVTGGRLFEVSDGRGPRLNVRVSNLQYYGGLESDKWIREPQQKLMQALWAFRTGT